SWPTSLLPSRLLSPRSLRPRRLPSRLTPRPPRSWRNTLVSCERRRTPLRSPTPFCVSEAHREDRVLIGVLYPGWTPGEHRPCVGESAPESQRAARCLRARRNKLG